MSSTVLRPPLPLPAPGAGVCAPVATVREVPAVDGLRVFAALAVICLHTEPFSSERMDSPEAWSEVLAWGVNVLSLFAVPYFFVVSGHFFGKRCLPGSGVTPWQAARKLLLRIVPLYAAWCLLYALVPSPAFVRRLGFFPALERSAQNLLAHAWERPLHLLCNGTSMQLWFLSALCLAAVMSALLLAHRQGRWLLPLAGLFFAVGLLGQAYGEALDVSLPWGVNTRLGPFFGFPLFALGVWQALRPPPLPGEAKRLLCLALPLLFLEAGALCLFFEAHVGHYYLASAPLGLGLLQLALARPGMLGRRLPRLGLLTSGIYLLHLGLLSCFECLQTPDISAAGWQLLLPLVLFALCALCTAGLRSLPGLRRLV